MLDRRVYLGSTCGGLRYKPDWYESYGSSLSTRGTRGGANSVTRLADPRIKRGRYARVAHGSASFRDVTKALLKDVLIVCNTQQCGGIRRPRGGERLRRRRGLRRVCRQRVLWGKGSGGDRTLGVPFNRNRLLFGDCVLGTV